MGDLFSINSPLWNAVNKLLHLLWLSILWILCSLPVVTIGAATAALYSVCLKYVKNEESYITSSFLRAVRLNFRQATVIWLLFMSAGCILGVDLVAYFRSDQKGMLHLIMLTVFFSVFVAFILSGIYVFALQAGFNNTIKRTIVNAFFMALKHWPISLTMLLIAMGILALGMMVFPPILFLAPALISYINSKFLVKIFACYLP